MGRKRDVASSYVLSLRSLGRHYQIDPSLCLYHDAPPGLSSPSHLFSTSTIRRNKYAFIRILRCKKCAILVAYTAGFRNNMKLRRLLEPEGCPIRNLLNSENCSIPEADRIVTDRAVAHAFSTNNTVSARRFARKHRWN